MSNTIDTAKLALISQGSAYGLLIGLSVVFCGVILIAVKVQKAYLSEDSGKSEMFMVANRSVGTGLTASAVFSSWMWINETVLAAAMCYRYGLALPLVCDSCDNNFLVDANMCIVVGFWSLLSNRIDGRTRRDGKNSSSICTYLFGGCPHEIWKDWPPCFHRVESRQQCLRVCLDDHDWVTVNLRCIWDALRRSYYSDSTWRYEPIHALISFSIGS